MLLLFFLFSPTAQVKNSVMYYTILCCMSLLELLILHVYEMQNADLTLCATFLSVTLFLEYSPTISASE